MLFKASILFVFLLFNLFTIHAQSSGKLEKLNKNEKYDKLITRSEKRIEKDKDDSIAYYYLILGLIYKSELSSGSVAERSYYQSTIQFAKYRKYFEGDTTILRLNNEFHKVGLRVIAELPKRNKRRHRYYTEFFAVYLSDTLESYSEYFPANHGIETSLIEHPISYANAADYFNSEKIIREKSGIGYKTPSELPPVDLIILKSEEVLGTPWVYTGLTPEKGFDCSGFILWTFSQFGYEFPHSTKMLAKIGKPIDSNDIHKADLVCFGSSDYSPERVFHVGLIYCVNKDSIQMIHCGTLKGVSVVPLSSGYWSEVDHFIVRIVE